MIFYINVPICLVALLASRRLAMPEMRRPAAFRLDVPGLALLSPALVAIVYGLSQAGSHGSFADARALVPTAIGAVLLAGFAIHALSTRGEPLLDLRPFRGRSYTSFSGVVFFFSMAMLGTALLLPLYYQQVRGEDACTPACCSLRKEPAWALRSSWPAGSPTASPPGRSSSPDSC